MLFSDNHFRFPLTVCTSSKTGTNFFIPSFYCLAPCLFVISSQVGVLGRCGLWVYRPACKNGECESKSMLVSQCSWRAKALTQAFHMITPDMNEHSTTGDSLKQLRLQQGHAFLSQGSTEEAGPVTPPPPNSRRGWLHAGATGRESLWSGPLFPTDCGKSTQIVVSGKRVFLCGVQHGDD